MTYLRGCPHCAEERAALARAKAVHPAGMGRPEQRKEDALRISDDISLESGGRAPSASGLGTEPVPSRGPFCGGGCGREVPVHGEWCDWCWRGRAA